MPRLLELFSGTGSVGREKVEAGDHFLYLAEVVDGVLQDEDMEPMVRVRRSGFQY